MDFEVLIERNTVVQDFIVSFQNDLLKLDLVLLNQMQDLLNSLTLGRVHIERPNIHLHTECLPITLHLHEVPKLLTVAHKLENVQNLAPQIVFS